MPGSSRTVLLRHTLRDPCFPGSALHHYDWMIERGSPEEHRLVTFRVGERIDQPDRSFTAAKIPDHRAAYLDFEGDIPGGRGAIERVAAGICRSLEIAHDADDQEPGSLVAEIDFGRGWRRFEGVRRVADTWQFTVTPLAQHDPLPTDPAAR